MRAVITGATSGIGKAMACQLAQNGWSLVLTGRNQTVLEQLQKNLPTAVEIAVGFGRGGSPLSAI